MFQFGEADTTISRVLGQCPKGMRDPRAGRATLQSCNRETGKRMNAMVSDSTAHAVGVATGVPETSVRESARGLLSRLFPQRKAVERRKEQRYAYPHLIVLTPLAADNKTPTEETIVVAGKHLSESGLGFFHPSPLPYRRMIASLETPEGGRMAFVMDLNWCRFSRHGWYESGGKFIEVVESPLSS